MAKIRAKEITCPNCAAPIAVRNVLKAKTVVCQNCDSQLDLTKPGFEVLAKLPPRPNDPEGISLGLKGTLPDGRACEVIGTLRFSAPDGDWWWDEWLLLAENGEYSWLQVDEGKFEWLQRFTPADPPTKDQLQDELRFTLDAETYGVKERGVAFISIVQGELTWRATVGEIIHYVDCSGPHGGFSVEWNDDEIEFYRRQRLSPREMRTLCGLEALNELDEQQRELRAQYLKGSKSTGCGAMILAAGGFLAFFLFGIFASSTTTVGQTSSLSYQPLEIMQGVDLGQVTLTQGQSYSLSISATLTHVVKTLDVSLLDPTGKRHNLFTVNNTKTKGHVHDSQSFIAERDGIYSLKLKGTAKDEELSTIAPLTSLSWQIRTTDYTGFGFFLVGPFLLFLAVLYFILSAFQRIRAVQRAFTEHEQKRSEILQKLRDEALVQES